MSPPPGPASPSSRFEQRLVRINGAAGAAQQLAWREAGSGLPLVLLHGIGSGAPAFEGQLEGLSHRFRVIAWDAPGYAESSPLARPQPMAHDYAEALNRFLAAIGVQEALVLGHSMGALMAAAFAARCASAPGHTAPSFKLRGLLLVSPARGYGQLPAPLRHAKWQERVQALARLGALQMGQIRAAALCAPGTSRAVVARAAQHMARVTELGYSQASFMLAHEQIRGHLAAWPRPLPLAFLCGSADAVTPLAPTQALAAEVDAPCTELAGLGHLPYLEDPAAFNSAVLTAALAMPQPDHQGHTGVVSNRAPSPD